MSATRQERGNSKVEPAVLSRYLKHIRAMVINASGRLRHTIISTINSRARTEKQFGVLFIARGCAPKYILQWGHTTTTCACVIIAPRHSTRGCADSQMIFTAEQTSSVFLVSSRILILLEPIIPPNASVCSVKHSANYFRAALR
jgi:hypothetical protein